MAGVQAMSEPVSGQPVVHGVQRVGDRYFTLKGKRCSKREMLGGMCFHVLKGEGTGRDSWVWVFICSHSYDWAGRWKWPTSWWVHHTSHSMLSEKAHMVSSAQPSTSWLSARLHHIVWLLHVWASVPSAKSSCCAISTTRTSSHTLPALAAWLEQSLSHPGLCHSIQACSTTISLTPVTIPQPQDVHLHLLSI